MAKQSDTTVAENATVDEEVKEVREVKEVVAGQDCGLNIENYNDIKVGDIVEGYEEFEVKRKL